MNNLMIIGCAGVGVFLLIGLICIVSLRRKRRKIEQAIQTEYDHVFTN